MADGIYIGMNGAAARMAQLDAIADNLANAETPGFRAARPQFSSLVPGAPEGPSPAMVVVGQQGVDERAGAPRVTGRPLDVRVDGDAWLTVSMGEDRIAYTRDGRLDLDGDGRLLSGGHPVQGERGDILVPPGLEVSVASDGAIVAGGQEIDRLALARLSGAIARVGPTLVHGAAEPVDEVRVHAGELEGSNARALESTVELVAAQRAYDHAMQAIQTSRRMDERAVETARLR